MDMRHTIHGDTQGIIARTITSFIINHTMPMSMAIFLRTTLMAITIARTMATIIVVIIATVMATGERTIAHTCGVMAAAPTGDIDGQASFHGRGPDTRPQPGQPCSIRHRSFLGPRSGNDSGAWVSASQRDCGSNAMGCLVSTSIAGWRARR
jgi:hypothetical protein